jgi:hypothetical protein
MFTTHFIKIFLCQALGAHTCNPIYSEAEIRRISVQSQPGQIVKRPYLEKMHHKKWLVEWLKV